MQSLIQRDGEEERVSSTLVHQAGKVLLHTLVAFLAWVGLMACGYAMSRPEIGPAMTPEKGVAAMKSATILARCLRVYQNVR